MHLKKIRDHKLAFVVLMIYIVLFIVRPKLAVESFDHTSYYLVEMVKILPIIFVLTSLIEAWVPKNVIISSLGKESGIKGILLSFLFGSVSAGPIYAAFPISKMLLKKGASVQNVVIILSAWAVIKIPMLANEAKFLGLNFMIVRWILTVISILIISYLMKLIIKERYMETEQEHTIRKITGIKINEQYCIGCSLCQSLQPDSFELIDKKARWIDSEIVDDQIPVYQNTINKCPASVIEFTLKENEHN